MVMQPLTVPWINRQIKRDVKACKHLYNKSQKNKFKCRLKCLPANVILKATHNNYFSRIFAIDASFGGNHRQFWKYIRAKHKDNNEISTCISDAKVKPLP